jgi:hypothetical protein
VCAGTLVHYGQTDREGVWPLGHTCSTRRSTPFLSDSSGGCFLPTDPTAGGSEMAAVHRSAVQPRKGARARAAPVVRVVRLPPSGRAADAAVDESCIVVKAIIFPKCESGVRNCLVC